LSNPIRVNNFSQSSWLIVGTSFVSTIIGSMILAQGENTVVILARAIAHSTLEPATINLLVAICALIAALLAAWQKLGPSPVALLILIAVIAIAGMFSSLLFRDDYTGGSCGEFEWPAGHLHAGYPYSWLDGEICVPPHTLISEYVRQHPEKAGWYPDFPAMFVDLLFWVNIGILSSLIAGIGCRITKTMNRVTCAKSPAGIGQEGESEHD
jgi:hypothetical protein